VDPYIGEKDVKAAAISRPVRGQQQQFRAELETGWRPGAAGRANNGRCAAK
jgi:hypothetical protein